MKDKIIIIGAGLCGTLLAVRLAQRGYEVKLFEKRPDMRTEDMDAGRSINLALSNRGLQALERIGLKEEILKECIPMQGRYIHPLDGEPFFTSYSGREGDYINSVSRGGLNVALLHAADRFDKVRIRFNCKCVQVDLANAEATFMDADSGEQFTEKGDVIIGTDGAGSAVRRSMMSRSTELLFNYSQDFLRHGYKELSIHPQESGGWRIEKNALHIWPRQSYMIIALPNLDGSFTVTMFNPFEGPTGFNYLNSPERVKAFFERDFPDLIQHMPHYVEEYFENPVGTLGTIKCYPWQAYGKALVMGDASHAIVPFYGQGMNAAFEDVFVFDQILDAANDNGDWENIFNQFQDARAENTNAIADLAIDNFHEMQDKVDDEVFIKKRKVELQLEQQFKDYYSKYSLVTFRPELPYSRAMHLGRKQDKLLMEICGKEQNSGLSLEEIHQRLMALQE